VQDRVVDMLRFIGSVGNMSLLTTVDYYYHKSHNKMVERGQECGMGIGGCNRLCPAVTGHRLVALFSLSVSIKDRSLHGPWSSHRLIIPSTYLLMGAERLVTLLSWAQSLFGPTDWSKHHIEAGPQVWGLGV
jgi:hypothetical protein